MSQAESSSAAVKPSGNAALHAVAADGWGQGVIVLLIVLSPIGLAVIIMAIGLAARAAWQIAHGASVEPLTPASMKLYGLLSYAVGSWFAVASAGLWSRRRGIQRDVFLFRSLTWPALTASIAGLVVVTFGVPVATHWLIHVTGGHSQQVSIDFNDAHSVAIVIFLFVVTVPVSEEILYRGLLVAWLRRLGWKDLTISLLGSLIFAANHIMPLGVVWGVGMVLLGVVLFALRLRYESLSPAWVTHILFNAQLTLPYPLMAWFSLTF
jgi:membrane protease YdiL (CAAX protease family)